MALGIHNLHEKLAERNGTRFTKKGLQNGTHIMTCTELERVYGNNRVKDKKLVALNTITAAIPKVLIVLATVFHSASKF